MKALDLFTGYGGITLALKEYVEPIAYVEIEEYAQKIIASRMADGSLPRAAILGDVKNVRGQIGDCDIIYGGFPCQDISVAGNGVGLGGKRSGLFYEVIRLTKEIRPSFVFLENVPAIKTRGLEQVIKAFNEVGYDCRWTCLSAASVGANHKRERWFLLGYAKHNGSFSFKKSGSTGKTICNIKEGSNEALEPSRANSPESVVNSQTAVASALSDTDDNRFRKSIQSVAKQGSDKSTDIGCNGKIQSLANTMCEGLEGQRQVSVGAAKKFNHACDNSWWKLEPSVGRVANGTSFRVDRIKALGNGVVPLQVLTAFKLLMGLNKITKENL